jgi:hypothetical protein
VTAAGSRPKQVYIGKVNRQSGEIKPTRQPFITKERSTVVNDMSYGTSFVLEKLTERLGLDKALHEGATLFLRFLILPHSFDWCISRTL